jgi:hypothetical protein
MAIPGENMTTAAYPEWPTKIAKDMTRISLPRLMILLRVVMIVHGDGEHFGNFFSFVADSSARI